MQTVVAVAMCWTMTTVAARLTSVGQSQWMLHRAGSLAASVAGVGRSEGR